MKKIQLILITVFASAIMFSCSKENFSKNYLDLTKDASTESASFTVAESGFETNTVLALEDMQKGVYTKGILEYSKNGILYAKVDFAANADNKKAKVEKDGVEYDLDLYKGKFENKKDAYYKVIEMPLVKAEDCNYELVSGIISYYKDDVWVASVDFGNGICDDVATKTTVEGSKNFSISKYF